MLGHIFGGKIFCNANYFLGGAYTKIGAYATKISFLGGFSVKLFLGGFSVKLFLGGAYTKIGAVNISYSQMNKDCSAKQFLCKSAQHLME